MTTPMAAPSGTAITKATITSAAVTPIASWTCERPSSWPSIASTSDRGGSRRGFTTPYRGRHSHAAITSASSARRTTTICKRVTVASRSRRHGLERRDIGIGDRREVGHADELCHFHRTLHPFGPELARGRELDDVAVEFRRGDLVRDLVDFGDELHGRGPILRRAEERDASVEGVERLLQRLGLLLDDLVGGDPAPGRMLRHFRP